MYSGTAAPTYQFSVEEYLKLNEVGIFQKDNRVELLNGRIILMPPVEIRHAATVRRLHSLFGQRFGEECQIEAQNPVVIDSRSMPQPDLLVLRRDFDVSRAPHANDVLLLVEVSESSLRYDQTDKRDAYARRGIVEYWLLDLLHNELQVFRKPHCGVYRSISIVRDGDGVAPIAFPNEALALSELLPP